MTEARKGKRCPGGYWIPRNRKCKQENRGLELRATEEREATKKRRGAGRVTPERAEAIRRTHLVGDVATYLPMGLSVATALSVRNHFRSLETISSLAAEELSGAEQKLIEDEKKVAELEAIMEKQYPGILKKIARRDPEPKVVRFERKGREGEREDAAAKRGKKCPGGYWIPRDKKCGVKGLKRNLSRFTEATSALAPGLVGLGITARASHLGDQVSGTKKKMRETADKKILDISSRYLDLKDRYLRIAIAGGINRDRLGPTFQDEESAQIEAEVLERLGIDPEKRKRWIETVRGQEAPGGKGQKSSPAKVIPISEAGRQGGQKGRGSSERKPEVEKKKEEEEKKDGLRRNLFVDAYPRWDSSEGHWS